MKCLGAAVLVVAGCGFAPGHAGGALDSGSGSGSDATHQPDAVVHDAAPANPTFVQGASDYANPWNNSGKTIAAAFTTNVKANSVIAVYVSWAQGASLSSVTDSLGNTFQMVDMLNDNNDGQEAATVYAVATSAGADTVTATLSGNQCCRVILVHEIANADPIAPLDAHSARFQAGAGTGSDQVTSGSATTTAAGDYVFAATSDGANVSGQQITAGSGETARETPTIPSGNPTMSEDQIQAAAGAITSTFTFSASNGDALTAQLAFKR